VYFLGELMPHGSRLYFLTALAVKQPEPLLILTLGGMALAMLALFRRALGLADAFWLLPGLLYIGLASFSSLQLGFRLILPAMPFLLLTCGLAANWCLRKQPWVLCGLLLWLGWQSASIYPHGLSYFNQISGGPRNALTWLADSNVDWGQGLPALNQFIRRNDIRHFRLSYFGFDNPYRFFKASEVEVIQPPWSNRWARGSQLEPKPGIYAISASLLPGHYFAPQYRGYYERFRNAKPVAVVAESIYIYQFR
jgi:hypothetical protein